MKGAIIIAAYPGFNVALAWEHDGKWVSRNQPVIAWAIRGQYAEPEPIAALTDGRSATARRFKDLVLDIAADLGGIEHL